MVFPTPPAFASGSQVVNAVPSVLVLIPVEPLQIPFVVRPVDVIERRPLARRIEKHHVVHRPELPPRLLRRRSLPDNLVPELPGAEQRVHDELQVVRRGRVALQQHAPRFLQHPPHLRQPLRHVGEVRQHARGTQQALERAHHPVLRPRRTARDPRHPLRRRCVPLPCVRERSDLCGRPVLSPEQDGVVGVRVERRVQVDEVDACVSPLPHDLQTVSVVERPLLRSTVCRPWHRAPPCGRFRSLPSVSLRSLLSRRIHGGVRVEGGAPRLRHVFIRGRTLAPRTSTRTAAGDRGRVVLVGGPVLHPGCVSDGSADTSSALFDQGRPPAGRRMVRPSGERCAGTRRDAR